MTEEKQNEQQDGALVRWGKWLGRSIYNILYETGGFFSELFGITTPKYGYIVREYEERQRRAREDEIEAANAIPDTECPVEDLNTAGAATMHEAKAEV